MPPTSAQIDITSIKGLAQDSRQVQEGFLFAALSGSKEDGRLYIADALHRGASIILAPEGTVFEGAKIITDPNPRRALSLLAAAFYGQQPEHVVAIGGTNGKTSTVHFIRQIWSDMGIKAASIGTLGIQTENGLSSGSMTTPDPITLHRDLAALAGDGVTHLAMEASSHGLDQYRIDGVKISVAGFTSFSRDHMDYHGDMPSYLMAKARLFSEVLMQSGVAVLNADIPEYALLSDLAGKAGHSILSYGFEGRDFKILHLNVLPDGQEMHLRAAGKDFLIKLPLVGGFQAMNALCAATCVIGASMNDKERVERVLSSLSRLQPVPGRLQRVSDDRGRHVFVDYAHTPDALDQAIRALRPHASGKRLFCLFGCGGDRDQGKRFVMGKVAAEQADVVIVTDDNPRSENPDLIRAEIIRGANVVDGDVFELAGRREAIAFALSQMGEGDVLLVAGKGHEQGQIFGGYAEPFDDVDEVQKAMRKLKEKKS